MLLAISLKKLTQVNIFAKAEFLNPGGSTKDRIGKYLKERNPNCRVVAVEPKNVSALKGHKAGIHKIQGIGDGFIPDILV